VRPIGHRRATGSRTRHGGPVPGCARRTWQAEGVARPLRRFAPTRLGTRRVVGGWLLAVVAPPVLTAVLLQNRDVLGLPSDLMMFFTLVVATAIVGGLAPSLVCALGSASLLNFFFTEPTRTWWISDPEDVLAVGVFALVAVAVASVVDLAERRSVQAAEAQAEAAALSDLSRAVLAGEASRERLLDVLVRHFRARGRAAVALPRVPDGPADDGAPAVPGIPSRADLSPGDLRVMAAFDAQARLIVERQELREASQRAQELEQVDALRTALLTAASHDLRTPLAAIRAAVDVLHAPGVTLSEEDRAEMTRAVAQATGRLEHIVDDLLDLSRLQMGAVEPLLRPTEVVEVVLPAVDGLPADRLEVDLPDGLPLVTTDAGLLERVVANVAANAVRHSPADHPARIEVEVADDVVVLRVVDHGAGVAPQDRERMFEPFERVGAERTRGPHRAGGMGLGLAVARGLADAVGARLAVEETPGGGLTMAITVPRARTGSA
jgi:two-component system, OmpR family, sensor histidine kinase KdpD